MFSAWWKKKRNKSITTAIVNEWKTKGFFHTMVNQANPFRSFLLYDSNDLVVMVDMANNNNNNNNNRIRIENEKTQPILKKEEEKNVTQKNRNQKKKKKSFGKEIRMDGEKKKHPSKDIFFLCFLLFLLIYRLDRTTTTNTHTHIIRLWISVFDFDSEFFSFS